jgi:hypothetical protein
MINLAATPKVAAIFLVWKNATPVGARAGRFIKLLIESAYLSGRRAIDLTDKTNIAFTQ